ncbi:aminomethyltransferase family protein [Curvivirga aplysinae]|uniref:aminomethyltransferase family protein n=1 Tax=Curvivirga aplysinae TaxID=2529852 RepID=UPI0012BC35BE|nr:aminomethyltransferase family protein [Curvivirga aplysinae]MTI10858.1 aminomethyl transferase family protein [Curvivirga aplysinae]
MSIAIERSKLGIKETPFFPRLKELSTTAHWEHWGGYLSPSELESLELEYFAIRSNATVFDISPMCKYRIQGPDAEKFMNRLITRDVRKVKSGRVSYVVWCNDEGHLLDDGTIFRFGDDDFRLCCQERQWDWLISAKLGFDVQITEETDEIAAIQFQGPTTCWFLKQLGLEGVENLKTFDLKYFDWNGNQLLVSRTGFTGDLGYELWIENKKALDLWDALFALKDERHIRAIGSGALNLARIEAGFLAPHVDFLSADHVIRSTRGRTPFEIGLGWQVDFNKGQFNGRRALLKSQKDKTDRYCFVGFEIDGNKPADHSLIYYKKKQEIGHFTSAMWSPTLKMNIGMALLKLPYGDSVQEELWTEIYTEKELKYDVTMAKLKVTDRPFFRNKRRTATPPADF